MRGKHVIHFLMGLLAATPILALAGTMPVSSSFRTCCSVAGVNCDACHTYSCCYTGCNAGYQQSSPPSACSLIHCADSCSAAFP